MPFQFLRLFVGPLSKMSILTSVPMSFLLVGLQAIMDVQFSCPCRVGWNRVLPTLILIVPALIALVIMLLLLRPCQYIVNNIKCCQGQDNSGTFQGQDNSGTFQGQDNSGTFQGQDNRGTSQVQDNSGTSQGQDNRGTSQGQDNRGTSQSEKALVKNCICFKAFSVCCIPCLVWICIFFIDGDYFACLKTDWDGRYACDKELHPNCLNWCKPNEITPGKNEAECYDRTRQLFNISKTTGYALAIILCIAAIIFVSLDCCECGKPACCRSTDPETQSPERQGTEGQLKQRTDNLQMSTIENANEDSSLLMTPGPAKIGQNQQGSGSSAKVEWQQQDSGSPSTIMESEKLLPHQGQQMAATK